MAERPSEVPFGVTPWERSDELICPPVTRASRWIDAETADSVTTAVLQQNEARLRRSAELREPVVEFRAAAPADCGVLMRVTDGEPGYGVITSVTVRVDVSRGQGAVVLLAEPDDLPLLDDSWDLLQVLGRLREDAVQSFWDPRQAIDEALRADPDRASLALAQWRAMVGQSPSPAAIASAVRWLVAAPVPCPEGVSWAAWERWFVGHLEARAAQPASAAHEPYEPETDVLDAGELDYDADVCRLSDTMLVAAGEEIGRWYHDPRGSRRRRFIARLDDSTGGVYRGLGDICITTHTTAVVLDRGAPNGPGTVEVLDLCPVPDGTVDDAEVRPGVLSAYLGSGLRHIDVQPWLAVRALLTQEPAHVIEEVLTDLERVRDAADPRRELLDRGVRILPVDVRGWLDRILWRARTFEWTGPGDDRDGDGDGERA